MHIPHLLLIVLSFVLFSSVFSILYVTIQNRRALKRYYQYGDVENSANEGEDYEAITPVYTSYDTRNYAIA